MMALNVASVSDLVPKDRIGGAMGILAKVPAVGTALGQSLGGVLVTAAAWPLVFGATAATGLFADVAVWHFLPVGPASDDPEAALDPNGVVVLSRIFRTFGYATTAPWV